MEERTATVQLSTRNLRVGILRDLTTRRAAERTRAFLASVVESSADAIVGTNTEFHIVSWNESTFRLYGYTAEEIIGRPLSILYPPVIDAEAELSRHQRLRRGDRIVDFETRRMRTDGTVVDVSLNVAPVLDPSGEITAFSAVI